MAHSGRRYARDTKLHMYYGSACGATTCIAGNDDNCGGLQSQIDVSAAGGRYYIMVSGFGKFSVRQKNARRGRNPQTKENLILRARKVVVFKTSGVLRNRINGYRP